MVTYGYLLERLIFVHEYHNEHFNVDQYVNTDLFAEVLKFLTTVRLNAAGVPRKMFQVGGCRTIQSVYDLGNRSFGNVWIVEFCWMG
jgi:hypothetical protein